MESRFGKTKKERIRLSQRNPATPSDNAKVKVQWIQNHRVVDKVQLQRQVEPQRPSTPASPHADTSDELVENVEYLDESAAQTQTSNAASTVADDSCHFVDTFYPNAVQCLIMLYGNKYVDMQQKSACAKPQIWAEISKDMNDSYFVFDAEQVRHKFRQLRQHYFQLASTDYMKAWPYFEQMHGIYGDQRIKSMVSGHKDYEAVNNIYIDEPLYQDELLDENVEIKAFPNENVNNPITEEVADVEEMPVDTENSIQQHHGELLAQSDDFDAVEEQLQEIVESPPKLHFSQEIQEHREDELIGNEMIMQHQEEIVHHMEQQEIEQQKEQAPPQILKQLPQQKQQQPLIANIQKIFIKRETQQQTAEHQKAELPPSQHSLLKRIKLELPGEMLRPQQPKVLHLLTAQQAQQQESLATQQTQLKPAPPAQQRLQAAFIRPVVSSAMPTGSSFASTSSTAAEFSPISLSAYNAAQERRHCEKMELLRQSLALQERSIEMQRQLLEQLINRL